MRVKTLHIQEDGNYIINKSTDPEVADGETVPIGDAEAHDRFGITEWIDAGNTPSPYVGPTDLENWVEDMHRSDAILPRWGEDILDGMPDKSGVNQISLDRLQAKKDLRGERP